MARTFDDLVVEADSAAVDGWDFSWLEVVDVRCERLRMEFFDIGAIVYFLRKVLWTVPGFTVESYRDALHELHQHIETEGSFVAHSSRTLIEIRKPT